MLGGGPAGLATALALRRHHGLEVLVLERGDYAAPRIGETLSPGADAMLRHLGAAQRFEADGHLPAYGTIAAWGSAEPMERDYLLTPFGAGWHLDRQRFDASLAAAAQDAGATVRTQVADVALDRAAGGWSVRIGTKTVSARWVVDATGRRGSFARRLGGRRHLLDTLVAVAAVLEPEDQAQATTLVESCEAGWWYSSPLPGGRLLVALMSDSDVVQKLRLAQPPAWQALLSRQPLTAARTRGAAPAALRTWPAMTTMMDPFLGERWIAVGDAAASHDPLSSSGIPRALEAGMHAAAAIAAALQTGRPAPLEAHSRRVREAFVRYWQTRHRYYAIEQRWPGAPFWQRRHMSLPAMRAASAEP